jgi:putative transposase
MSHTYSSLFIHLVWSTQDSIAFLEKPHNKRMYDYIGGIIKAEKASMLAIGGMPDHIHILVGISPTLSIPNFVRAIKTSSSKFIRETHPDMWTFGWQDGYGVFAVSVSMLNVVKNYINKQEEHHAKGSFEEEFRAILAKHNLAYRDT